MRTLALLPILLATTVASAERIPDPPYEPPPQPKYCWECSLKLLVADGSPGGSIWTYSANAISAEKCADSLYDQVVDDFGTSPAAGTLKLPDGSAFYLHPAWVDYYASASIAKGIWDEWTCDDTDWEPSWPLPLPGDGEEPADG